MTPLIPLISSELHWYYHAEDATAPERMWCYDCASLVRFEGERRVCSGCGREEPDEDTK
jgi:hypothetical protein